MNYKYLNLDDPSTRHFMPIDDANEPKCSENLIEAFKSNIKFYIFELDRFRDTNNDAYIKLTDVLDIIDKEKFNG